jgi:hypothetical protein
LNVHDASYREYEVSSHLFGAFRLSRTSSSDSGVSHGGTAGPVVAGGVVETGAVVATVAGAVDGVVVVPAARRSIGRTPVRNAATEADSSSTASANAVMARRGPRRLGCGPAGVACVPVGGPTGGGPTGGGPTGA